MNRLEFHISYSCINNCIFCSESEQLKKFKDSFVDSELVKDELAAFSRRGFNHITFTGGEPTLHPDIKNILLFARNLGYKTYLTSNGSGFDRKNFCKEIFPYLNEVCFSIHGSDSSRHDNQTSVRGSFKKLLKAMDNLEFLGFDTRGFANIVVTKRNLVDVPDIIERLAGYTRIKQVLISNMAPEGRGFYDYEKLNVPLSYIRKAVPAIVETAVKKGLCVVFFGVPLCVLGRFYKHSNDLCWSPRTTLELWHNRRVILKETRSFKPVRKRVKPSVCRNCSGHSLCAGVFEKYFDLYGGDELRPYE